MLLYISVNVDERKSDNTEGESPENILWNVCECLRIFIHEDTRPVNVYIQIWLDQIRFDQVKQLGKKKWDCGHFLWKHKPTFKLESKHFLMMPLWPAGYWVCIWRAGLCWVNVCVQNTFLHEEKNLIWLQLQCWSKWTYCPALKNKFRSFEFTLKFLVETTETSWFPPVVDFSSPKLLSSFFFLLLVVNP